MILDPWTFLGRWRVDLITNRGIQCGIDIQGKGLSYSKGQKTLLARTTTSQKMSKWAWMNGTTSKLRKKHCETCPWRIGTFWGTSSLCLLQGQYCMQLEVEQFVSWCMVYDWVCVSFNAPTPNNMVIKQ
jgi:hypothetical protein